MKDLLKQIEGAARSLKLKLPFSPGYDPAHDLVDRIIELCGQAEPVDRALAILRAKYDNVVGAVVTQYEVSGKWLGIGVPKHQPLIQQIDWCRNKRAAFVEITIGIHDDTKQIQMIETFNINDFK